MPEWDEGPRPRVNLRKTPSAGQRVNLSIRRSLYDISLAQLAGLDGHGSRMPAIEREFKVSFGRRGGAALP